jgi:hypothetical protein
MTCDHPGLEAFHGGLFQHRPLLGWLALRLAAHQRHRPCSQTDTQKGSTIERGKSIQIRHGRSSVEWLDHTNDR